MLRKDIMQHTNILDAKKKELPYQDALSSPIDPYIKNRGTKHLITRNERMLIHICYGK